MIQSMTGYGKAIGEINNKKIVVEIKSLNSKQFDLSTRITNPYREKELEVRNRISLRLERGKIEFSLQLDNSSKETDLSINQKAITLYYNQLKEVVRETGMPPVQDWLTVLLRFPEVIKNDPEELNEDEWIEIEKLIDEALNQLIEFRIQEGKVLEEVFTDKILKIGELLAQIEPFENERIDKIRARLEENLLTLSEKIEYDKNRLEQELIFYIEKLDVNEEKVRLRNHLDYFIDTMRYEKSAGKKLGFIAQEIGREVNTLGSKSNHSEMQKIVIQMKDELEQIKEQVLNTL